jgi:hypothetical protein
MAAASHHLARLALLDSAAATPLNSTSTCQVWGEFTLPKHCFSGCTNGPQVNHLKTLIDPVDIPPGFPCHHGAKEEMQFCYAARQKKAWVAFNSCVTILTLTSCCIVLDLGVLTGGQRNTSTTPLPAGATVPRLNLASEAIFVTEPQRSVRPGWSLHRYTGRLFPALHLRKHHPSSNRTGSDLGGDRSMA